MPAAEPQRTVVPTSAPVYEPTSTSLPAPDERELADADAALVVAQVETGETPEIADLPAGDIRWSPDGVWLTWLHETDDGRLDLYAQHRDASEPFRAATDLPVQHWLEWAWVPRE